MVQFAVFQLYGTSCAMNVVEEGGLLLYSVPIGSMAIGQTKSIRYCLPPEHSPPVAIKSLTEKVNCTIAFSLLKRSTRTTKLVSIISVGS